MTELNINKRLNGVEHQIRSLDTRTTQQIKVFQSQGEQQLALIRRDFAKLEQKFKSQTRQQQDNLQEIRQENPASMPWFYINLALIALSTGLLSYFITSSIRSPHFSTVERIFIMGNQNP